MDKERNNDSLFSVLLRSFGVNFTLTILVILFVGILVSRYAPGASEISTLFSPVGAISYGAILQFAGLSCIITFFIVLFLSDRFFIKMRFLLRFFLIFLSTLLSTAVFAIVFKWLPLDSLFPWIYFVLSFIICFLICSGAGILKFKLENKKYNKLLENYKAKH
jgi:hypothetical protein